MKKSIFFMLLIMCLPLLINAQETVCGDSEEKTLEDLNSITKYSIKHSKKSDKKSARQISARVSVPKKDF